MLFRKSAVVLSSLLAGMSFCICLEPCRAAIPTLPEYELIDKTGKVVMPVQFRRSPPQFRDEQAEVFVWSFDEIPIYVNHDGTFSIRRKPKDGLSFRRVKRVGNLRNDSESIKSYYVKQNGEPLLPFDKFDDMNEFHEGLALYRFADIKGPVPIIAFVNHEGEIIKIEMPKHTACVGDARDFHNGIAAVKFDQDDWGFVDKNGKLVILPLFAEVSDFSDGLAKFLPGNYEYPSADPSKVDFVDRKPLSVPPEHKYGYIDVHGKVVIPPTFEAAGDFHDGLARASKNGKWGFIDKTGKFVIQPRFDGVSDYSEGLAGVWRHDRANGDYKNLVGYIDRNQKLVVNLSAHPFEVSGTELGAFSEGLAGVAQSEHNETAGAVIVDKLLNAVRNSWLNDVLTPADKNYDKKRVARAIQWLDSKSQRTALYKKAVGLKFIDANDVAGLEREKEQWVEQKKFADREKMNW